MYALSEIADHMSLLRGFYGLLAVMSPGMIGLGDCESLFTRLPGSIRPFIFRESSKLRQMASWIMRIGFRKLQIPRMGSPEKKTIRFRFFARYCQGIFVLAPLAPCVACPRMKWGRSSAFLIVSI